VASEGDVPGRIEQVQIDREIKLGQLVASLFIVISGMNGQKIHVHRIMTINGWAIVQAVILASWIP
jgi:hypothetical protein